MAKRLKIAFFELEDWEKEYIKKSLKNDNLKFIQEPLSIKTVNSIRKYDVIGIFIYSKVDINILNKLPHLKLITSMSTGFDHIDITECKNRNIKVCNVPSYGENTVAEHTFALLLSISRKIHQSYDNKLHNDYSLANIRGFDLKGKTIGIIGGGNIGMHVARIANGFEMRILVFDIKHDKLLAKKLGFKYVTLSYLLSHSDIISIHCPYNKYTHHLINEKNINLIKKGSILLNTARGAIVETESLIYALKKRILSYAGLDVLEDECFIKEEKQLLSREHLKNIDLKTMLENQMIIHLPNVLYTPHNAFNSEEALKRILDTTISNIKGFKSGKIVNSV